MKYAIVYAHPNTKSFNHAIKERVEANLKRDGKEFVVRDLYNLKFNPVLDSTDFTTFHEGRMPPDISREQDFIRTADTLVFIHPIWWFGMPAILKGYIDRVFSRGFAYDYDANGLKGLLPGKKVVILNTTGGAKEAYENYGLGDALKKTMEAGLFETCGMKIALHKYFYAVPAISNEARAAMLEELKNLSI